MKILPITSPTEQDKNRLEELKKIEKSRRLTNKEAAEQVFLSVKDLWNCEC